MKRVEWVDGLKACAVFLVVLGHVIGSYKEDSVIYQFIYLYHMPLFFMVSGITFCLSVNKAGLNHKVTFKYLVYRIINLSIPMLVFVVIDFCFMPNEDIFFYYNGVWFLLHLCMILIAYFVFEKFHIKQIGFFLILIGWIVAGLIQLYFIQNNNLVEAKFACEISKWCGYFIMFNFGIYAYTYVDLFKNKAVEFILGVSFLLAVVITFAVGMQDNIALFRIIAGIPGGGICFCCFLKRKKIYSFERLFSVASLEIYLIHVNILQRIILPHTSYGNQLGIIKIFYTISLLVAYLIIPLCIYKIEEYSYLLKCIFHPVSVLWAKNKKGIQHNL